MDRSTYDTGVSFGFFSESSINTPGFHSLRKQGSHLPIHPYTWQRCDGRDPIWQTPIGPFRFRQLAGYNTFVDAITIGKATPGNGGEGVSCLSIDNGRSVVLNRLLSKVRNTQVDLGVALGERAETAHFIASAMQKTARSFVQLRHGNVSAALRTLTGRRNSSWRDIPGAASDTWLAYCYGLRPLLKDVHDAVSVYQKRFEPIPELKTVKSRKDFTVLASTENSFGYGIKVLGGFTVKGQVTFRTTNPVLKTLEQCGVINPLSVAWELVPFSFVVDWFIPIGQFISGIVPPQGVDFVDGWVSVSARGFSANWTNLVQSPGVYIRTRMEADEVYKNRQVLTSFPRYHLVVPDVSLGSSQIASGIALLYQALSTRKA